MAVVSDKSMAPAALAQPPLHKRRKRLLRRFRLVAFLLLVAFALTEFGLRTFLGLGSPLLYTHDASCVYLPVPNQDFTRLGCRNTLNSLSMRSPEFAPHKSRGMLRLMFLGDSIVYGTTHVDQQQIFTSLLARDLPRRLRQPVEILNASAGGWAPGNEAGYLRSRGTFESDAVFLVLNTGDLGQPTARPPLTLEYGFPERRPLFASYELWVRYVSPRFFGLQQPMDPGSSAPLVSSLNEWFPRELEFIKDVQQSATRGGAAFAIIFSPFLIQAHEPALADAFHRLQLWAGENDILLLDLAATYSALRPEEIYLDTRHLRPRGNELVAAAIEENLSRLLQLPSSAAKSTTN